MSDNTYAPKSPDLSSFSPAGPTQSPYRQTPSQLSLDITSHPRRPSSLYYVASPQTPYYSQQSPQQPQVYSPQVVTPGYQYPAYFPQEQYFPPRRATAPVQIQGPAQVQAQLAYGLQVLPTTQQQQQQQQLSHYHHHQPYGGTPPQLSQLPRQQPYLSPPPAATPAATTPSSPGQQESLSPLDTTMPPRKSAPQAAQSEIEPSPVRTKFPTARIKRIMQADEEVGKVAQQTPIAVGKALELFMIQLVSKSAEVAKEKNSKRVSAQMLKDVVESDEQWDFLREIVGKVDLEEKAARAGGRVKNESDSDEDFPVEKKKGRPGRKKKS